MEFTVGATYSNSVSEFKRLIEIPSDEDGSTNNIENTSIMKLNQWRFIVGFSLPFSNTEKN